MATLSPSFLIGSSSVLQVRRPGIKAWMNFRQIRKLTAELAALLHLKYQCLDFVSVAIDSNFFKFADKEEIHNILDEFEFWQDRTTDNRVSCH